MAIRPYQPADLRRLHHIDQSCFPRGVSYTLAGLRSFVENSRSFTLVAETTDGVIAGFIIGQTERARGGGGPSFTLGRIITIDVLPDFRGQGQGTDLLLAMEALFRLQGARRILLETATDNEAAISFYRKYGYRPVRRLKTYYPNGTDAYLMVKPLEQ